MKIIIFLIINILLLYACSEKMPVEPAHILSHNQSFVVTDPSKGFNSYANWTVFPDQAFDYRKIILHVTYECPDSLHCGEWDYVDNIFVRRTTAYTAASKDIELARIISPYGWLYDSTWKFSWHVDISDYGILLRDSVEIDFRHSGYENSEDRGWLVTLDFEIFEGQPAIKCLGIDTLWQGNFPYGDSTNPIENYLKAKSLENIYNADFARLRVIQTGHGMDDFENCAEFCSKWRKIYWNDHLIDDRPIWRECGTNSLFPQAGTWIFDRAGWCPGEIVYPDLFDLSFDNQDPHVLKMEMEPYINPNKPTAVYNISALVFYYAEPAAKYDISIEEIITPGNSDKFSRLNPVCFDPQIIIKNNGKEELTDFDIIYGIDTKHMQHYPWKGILASQQPIQISLPGILEFKEGQQKFTVILKSPNGKKDEYAGDNMLSSIAEMPPVYPTQFILNFRSNNDSTHNAYSIINSDYESVLNKDPGSLYAGTLYSDTLNLAQGCYQLIVSDTAGDGLDFWFNPEGGYGYVRFLDMEGKLIKSFGSDFGSEIRYSFVVQEGVQPPTSEEVLPLVKAVPARNYGTFELEIFNNEPEEVRIWITDADSITTVTEKVVPSFKEGFLPFDITAYEDGIYRVYVEVDKNVVMKRIRMKRK